ncbi:MAG TPA: hypothetical protein VK638_41375 [Edaphobacter sp.]|nr:hypothetical protein [Edaphobacter sp.]
MANTKTFSRSFAGGEISPSMFGRIDDSKLQTGAATMRNFIASPQGPTEKRPGFAYVNSTKNNGVARLIPFTFNIDQTMVIELGIQYIRFHTQGQTLMNGGVPYEISSPYLAADLFDIHYVQSSDVMTLVHPSYAPMELRRMGATNWTLAAISFGTTIAPPATVSVTASPGYLAQIANISLANPAVITTAASHTLSLGDGIFISGLTAVIGGAPADLSGFYLVNLVPTDTSGNLILNELEVMNYSGNVLDASGWDSFSGPATIQFGTKIFDINNTYAVSAINQNSVDESILSSEVSAICNLNVAGSFNTITWSAVPGALRYNVYKLKNGLFGFIGVTPALQFVDNNIAPDFSITPPNVDGLFTGANNFPGAVSYFEQRRCFAGSNNNPQNVWMSNSGTESTFTYSLPIQSSDRISFRVASRDTNQIRQIIPLTQMVLLTSAGEFAVNSGSNDALTPSNIWCRQQSYVGSSNVQPTIINNSLVYCAARGGHVRELGYSWQSNGFVTGDLSMRAIQLFDGLTIVDQAFMKAPRQIVWFVSSNGNLLGLTYVPEEQIGAWHRHDTDGIFESITVVAEGNEDRLYAVIQRTVNGNTVRYVERMASKLITTLEDYLFVDAGSTYSGPPATTISGLTWLEGKTVAVLADGAVQNRKVVTGGSITLDHPASKVQVGLPYQSDLQTVPLTLQIEGFGQGRQKNVNKIWVRVIQSSGIFAGPDADHLTEAKQRTIETYGSPPNLQNSVIELVITPSWNTEGQVFIRQDNPLPLTVVGLTIEVAIGG